MRGSGEDVGGPISNAVIERILETSPVAITVLESEGNIVLANEYAETVFGISKDVITSRTYNQQSWNIHDSDGREIPDDDLPFARVMATGEPVMDYEHSIEDATGTRIDLRINAAPVFDGDEIDYVVTATEDVTERNELVTSAQTARARAENYFDLAGAILVVLDTDGTISNINRRGCEVLGWERSALLGADWFETVLPTEDRAEIRAVFDALMAGDLSPVERYHNEVVTASGTTRVVEWQNTVLEEDGEIVGTLSSGTDVTDRRRRNRELERQNERLESFASVVSHDLRNPLNVVEGRLELFEETGDEAHLEPVFGAIDRMNTLIDDVLTLAREGRTVEGSEAVDLEAVAAEAWEHVETDGAVLSVAEGTVYADETRLMQIFENLMRNSIEHGVGEEVTVADGDDALTIRIETEPTAIRFADDGVGIPDGLDPMELFEPGVSNTTDGTGMGLAIVKEIAEAHGWTVAAESGVDGGFGVRFDDVAFVRTGETD